MDLKGYLIDPETKTISEVQVKGDYTAIYGLIDARTFDVVRIGNSGDVIYIDDEGLLQDPPKAVFGLFGYPQPLAGKGLVLGTDNEGESINPRSSLKRIQGMINC